MRLDLGSQMTRAADKVFRVGDGTPDRFDPDGLRRATTVPVWVHRFMTVASIGLNMALVTAVAVVHTRPSPPPRVEGRIAFQPQPAGIQSDGGEPCVQ